jgi:hypothetical protein
MNDEERKMLEDVHGFLFKQYSASAPPRAEQFDVLLSYWKTGRSVIKVVVWIGAFSVALAAGFDKVVAVIGFILRGGGG